MATYNGRGETEPNPSTAARQTIGIKPVSVLNKVVIGSLILTNSSLGKMQLKDCFPYQLVGRFTLTRGSFLKVGIYYPGFHITWKKHSKLQPLVFTIAWTVTTKVHYEQLKAYNSLPGSLLGSGAGAGSAILSILTLIARSYNICPLNIAV